MNNTKGINRISDTVPEGVYTQNQQVRGYIHSITPLGYRVCFDDKYFGLLYKDEISGEYELNQKVDVYIKKVREDFKVDLSVQKVGYIESSKDVRTKILEALKKSNGVLRLSDKSSPELIFNELGMSKKKFKDGIGSLYREKVIVIYDDRVELKKDS
ncbi:hypothetical protein KC660_00570 [Candidatus Dojkabacteria bacterium]|uniref:S1 motif domain-containing protein n=1 Tax=Candidatus Dojkabacteria bacterium TaxID=2099670 RepID=A0A955RHT4_9BACT|nr:hypothetical protein [Candidatus Dojkabacteria bacterium]